MEVIPKKIIDPAVHHMDRRHLRHLDRDSSGNSTRSSAVGRTPEFTHLAWHEIP